MSERDVLIELNKTVAERENHMLVTFFGGPKYGTTPGFDIPALRTRYLMNGIPEMFPFKGMTHLDLSEVAQRYFNTMVLQEPTLKSLSASQVVELTKECDLHPLKTKDANMQQLEKEGSFYVKEISNFINKHVEQKAVAKNSLDGIFKIYCSGADESLLNEKYSGSDVPMLFEKYKESNDAVWLQEILNHNKNCIAKTKALYDMFVGSELISTLSLPTTRL